MASIPIAEISRQDVQDLELPVSASITNVQPLSSYNWIEAPLGTPTIVVPGSPAQWAVPPVSRRLKKDSGLTYIAQNAARHPESPLEPLFRAVYITRPSFDIKSIGVVTDRNNIRKLLSFVDPASTKNGIEAFTINIEMVQNTAIFCRDEAKTMEYIGPQEFRGYGHEFERAYTISQISGSTGHHRIISYCFGGLNFIVRHETDGYVGSDKRISTKCRDDAEDSISDLFGTLSLSSSIQAPGVTPGSKLVVKEEGEEISLESTLEIKTRTLYKPLEIADVAAQLWISQTPKLVRAYHQNGTFQRPVVEDVAAAIKSWERRKQNELRKLAALIQEIISLVKGCKGNAVLKYDKVGDKLVICKAEKKLMLPEDLYLKWNDEQSLDAKTSTPRNSM